MSETNAGFIENEENNVEKSLESVLGNDHEIKDKIEKKETNKETKVNLENKPETVDPWSYKAKFPIWWIVLVMFVGPILLPIRLLGLIFLWIVSYITSRAGLACLPTSEKPLTGWRKTCQNVVFLTIRLVGGCLGVWVVKRGTQAKSEEAPLIVVAPHSTFIDWLAVGHTKASPVAKSELSKTIFFGAIGRLIQTVWVDRDAEDSKKETARMINKRSSEVGWPQTLVFPEGTNTNGKALVQFRTGAFATSKPVQPIVFSFPNMVDTITWTWIQKFKPYHLLILTLLTPITIINMEFLPVLGPSKQEEDNPKMFADRVRCIMSEHLKIPTVDVSFKDAVAAKKDFKLDLDSKEPDTDTAKYASTSSIDFVGNLTLGI